MHVNKTLSPSSEMPDTDALSIHFVRKDAPLFEIGNRPTSTIKQRHQAKELPFLGQPHWRKGGIPLQ